ncbi:unnamed protein product [Cercospora beticola]|nr:unnamed protein product [Cercospora beticola]
MTFDCVGEHRRQRATLLGICRASRSDLFTRGLTDGSVALDKGIRRSAMLYYSHAAERHPATVAPALTIWLEVTLTTSNHRHPGHPGHPISSSWWRSVDTCTCRVALQ